MDEKASLDEVNRRWEVLLSRKRQSDELVRPIAVPPDRPDPFDCSDCAVPPTFALVEDAVRQAVNEWRDLDDRKIPEEEALQGGGSVKKKPKWYNMHVRLPASFDVSTKDEELPADDGGGDRVIRLDDPTETGSYHQELWRLFKAVPTRSELENEALEGLSSPAMVALRDKWRKLDEKNQLANNFQVSSLRSNDRHGAPEIGFSPPSQKTKGTIIFEVWRGMIPHLTKNSSTTEDRLVLEFRGDQTLTDFHRAIVELSGDEFWERGVLKGDESEARKQRSGTFIIEEKIYTFGEVNYSIPIMEWLKEDETRAKKNLGVELPDLSAVPMNSIRLEEISMRLGIRYLHVHSGSVKSQVFLIDRRHGYPRQPSIARNYPIIHDMWTSGWSPPECESCRRHLATVVTSPECDLTDGSKTICRSCVNALRIPEKDFQSYNVWKICGTRGS